jgi:hypothetical protein
MCRDEAGAKCGGARRCRRAAVVRRTGVGACRREGTACRCEGRPCHRWARARRPRARLAEVTPDGAFLYTRNGAGQSITSWPIATNGTLGATTTFPGAPAAASGLVVR